MISAFTSAEIYRTNEFTFVGRKTGSPQTDARRFGAVGGGSCWVWSQIQTVLRIPSEIPFSANAPGKCGLVQYTRAGCRRRATWSDPLLNDANVVKCVSLRCPVEGAKRVDASAPGTTWHPDAELARESGTALWTGVVGVTSSTPSGKTGEQAPSAAVPAGTA